MNEKFLHYIWQYKLYKHNELFLPDGVQVHIINQGEHNTNSGPDFLNAKIKINQTIWAGNIEIHVKASDWIKHNHQSDKNYDNIILHVVLTNDIILHRQNGEIIPTVEIKYFNSTWKNYNNLIHSKSIACSDKLNSIDNIFMYNWLNHLAIERLENKTENINSILNQNTNNWEETFYQLVTQSFGLKTNAYPFRLLAKSIKLSVLAKHKNSLFQIEALLFGQAGFLSGSYNGKEDDYFKKLSKEYSFLKKKYELIQIDVNLWKFLRLRPGNFPTIRIAQLSKLITKSSSLFSKIREVESVNEIQKLLSVKTSSYWETHYLFNKESKKRIKTLGKSAINSIIINTIVPITFVFAKSTDNTELKEKALILLQNIPSENNSITRKWKELGVKIPSAYFSQAIIELNNNYCIPKKCLYCQIGYKVLTYRK